MTPGRLAQYTLALNAICRDPRQFHGHDLIGELQEYMYCKLTKKDHNYGSTYNRHYLLRIVSFASVYRPEDGVSNVVPVDCHVKIDVYICLCQSTAPRRNCTAVIMDAVCCLKYI
jgi:hypothetical protein